MHPCLCDDAGVDKGRNNGRPATRFAEKREVCGGVEMEGGVQLSVGERNEERLLLVYQIRTLG